MTIVNLPLPDQKELKNLIKQIAINTNSNLEEQDLNELSIASSGLTEIKVKQVTAKALAQRGKISKEDIKDIGPFPEKLEIMDYLFQRESYSLEHKEPGNHLPQNQFPRVGRCRYLG